MQKKCQGNADCSQGLAAQPRVACITRLRKAALSGTGEVAAISPVILTNARSDTMVADEGSRLDDVRQEVKTMSYATVQDVLFALDLDRFRVAEPAEATPRRPRGRTRISGSRAQSSGQAQAVVQMSRAAQPRPRPSRHKVSCIYTHMGIYRGRPASVHVNQQVHLGLLLIRLTPPAD